MTVPELLTAAKLAHRRYRTAHLTSGNKDKATQGAAVQAALVALLDAEKADPAHADPAWFAFSLDMNGIAPATLIEFYGRFLGGPEPQVSE